MKFVLLLFTVALSCIEMCLSFRSSACSQHIPCVKWCENLCIYLNEIPHELAIRAMVITSVSFLYQLWPIYKEFCIPP